VWFERGEERVCGIIAYVGNRRACEVLVKGLKRLEYRGYDSVGVAVIRDGKIEVKKGAGKIDELVERLGLLEMDGHVGIGQTRWATHGVPNDVNAHPHTDCTGTIALVHNGIIENFQEIRKRLMKKHKLRSETDTELIAHLIEEELARSGSFEEALRRALSQLKGSYALAILYTGEPDRVYLVRKESPMILGLGGGENFAASDVPAFLEYTNRAVFLDDGEYAIITRDSYVVKRLDSGREVKKLVHTIGWTLEMAEKKGHHHFMLKEIFEQPSAIADAIRGNVEIISGLAEELMDFDRIILTGMGTSYHAALVGKYYLQRLAGVVPIVEEASEFRYEFGKLLNPQTLVIAITQSGETADTLAAIKLAKKMGAKVLSVVNVVGSMATRLSDWVLYTHAGPEIGVAATKTYTTQLTTLLMLTAALGGKRGWFRGEKILENLRRAPEFVESVLTVNPMLRELAAELIEKKDFFYIGRGLGFPTALEGALKLKEISYVHAEGLSAGELKHGPLALIEEGMPVVAIAPGSEIYNKMVSNIEEARTRGAEVVAFSDREETPGRLIKMPSVPDYLVPIVYIVPLQLFAYHLAVLKGNDPDKPRNLAKSVTVE